MLTLVAAYLIAWAAVSAYVGRLAVQNVRLARRLEALEAGRDEPGNGLPCYAKAA